MSTSSVPRICQWGLEGVAYPLYAGDPQAALTPEGQRSLAKAIQAKASERIPGGKKLNVRDVQEYVAHLATRSQNGILKAVSQEDEAKDMAIRFRQKLIAAEQRIEDFNEFSNALVEDARRMREGWGGDAMQYPPMLIKAMETAIKLQKEGRESLKFIKEDGEVRNFIKIGTIENKTGKTDEEVLDLLVRVGKELGHSEGDVFAAYSSVVRKPKTAEITDYSVE